MKRRGDFLPRQGGAYLPKVSIFRSFDGIGCTESYEFYLKPKFVNIFATAAFRHANRKGADEERWPELKDQSQYWLQTQQKIRCMCFTAILNGHNILVLGAFGNGAFGNPAKDTIEYVFKPVLEEFKGWFVHIGFAVLCGKDTTNFNEYMVLHGYPNKNPPQQIQTSGPQQKPSPRDGMVLDPD